MAAPDEKIDNSLVEFILDKFPDSLHTRSVEGFTPLHLAFLGQRITAAKALVKAGADQTVRDSEGRNLLHHILISNGNNFGSPKIFQALSEILDSTIIKSLATQRTHVRFAARYGDWAMRTPLSQWLDQAHNHHTETLREILKLTGGKDLYVLDGQGNYPIHQVVRAQKIEYARVMLEIDPSLATLENATGVTPLEVVENKLVSRVISKLKSAVSDIENCPRFLPYFGTTCPSIYNCFDMTYYSLKQADPKSVYAHVGDKPLESAGKSNVGKIVHLLRDAAAKPTARKRSLVSLHDANQLVRRLEANNQKIGAIWRPEERNPDSEDEEEDQGNDKKKWDEVQKWRGELRKRSLEVEKILEEEKGGKEDEEERSEDEEDSDYE